MDEILTKIDRRLAELGLTGSEPAQVVDLMWGPNMPYWSDHNCHVHAAYLRGLAEAQWRPITPDSLPKAGDEVGGYSDGPFCEHVTAEEEVYTAAQWTDWGYRWHRPLGIPEG